MPGRPKVSVVMPVFNGARYLGEAIQSVLDQTFTDFELIIIDDGSCDNSYCIASTFSDIRIRLVRHSKNMGVVAALNHGFMLARGELIARMDADDICLPQRLSRQVSFMEHNSAVGISGSWMLACGESGSDVWSVPLSHNSIKSRLLFQSPLFHPTVIIRKACLNNHLLHYLKEFEYAEDYELWSRCVSHFQLANLGEVLVNYRIHGHSIGSRVPESKQSVADLVRLRWLHELGLQPTDYELVLHRQLSLVMVPNPVTPDFLEKSHNWLLRLKEANVVVQAFPEPEFSLELSGRWFLVCNESTSLRLVVLMKFFRSPLAKTFSGAKRTLLAFAVKCIMGYYRR
ncbi:glycosyltransferase [Geotalea sp. SG265]|uniref:glycosyltransferase family 2 protein n=1 Tax=Geotalea sp. SG265 TaxID=2922867 RepID=UPI001FAF902E|nr:glycosyltransferase [Geotalea sp. SG265]